MIIMFCGPAGAGKSTIARRLHEMLEGARMISSEWFKKKAYKRMFTEVERSLGKQKYLILDATFYRKSYREKITELASNREKVLTVFVHCPLELCIARNKQRANPIPEEAVHIMWRQFEKPENADVIIDSAVVGVEEIVDLILDGIRTSSA